MTAEQLDLKDVALFGKGRHLLGRQLRRAKREFAELSDTSEFAWLIRSECGS
jgi:hypothetical protein